MAEEPYKCKELKEKTHEEHCNDDLNIFDNLDCYDYDVNYDGDIEAYASRYNKPKVYKKCEHKVLSNLYAELQKGKKKNSPHKYNVLWSRNKPPTYAEITPYSGSYENVNYRLASYDVANPSSSSGQYLQIEPHLSTHAAASTQVTPSASNGGRKYTTKRRKRINKRKSRKNKKNNKYKTKRRK